MDLFEKGVGVGVSFRIRVKGFFGLCVEGDSWKAEGGRF